MSRTPRPRRPGRPRRARLAALLGPGWPRARLAARLRRRAPLARRRRPRRRGAGVPAVAVLAAVALTACGIRTDAEPRDITGGRQQELTEVGRGNTQIPAGGSRIYLVDAAASAQSPLLRAVARDVAAEPESVIAALLDGPTASERAGRLRSAIPAETAVLAVRYDGPGLLTVDLTPTILDAAGDTLVDAVAQIVYTLSEIAGVKQVQLQVDGASRQWPTGDGTLTDRPLTVYLYPGRAASTQPDYPALP